MTIAELIKELQTIDNQKRIVLLSSDEEGNRYNHLQSSCLSTCVADVSDLRNIEIGLEKLTDSLKNDGYTEEDVITNGTPAIIIYP